MTDVATAAAAIGWLQETNIQAAIIGPFITTVIGWVTHYYQQGQRKKTNLGTHIQKIEQLAIEHWCCPGSDTNNKIRGVIISTEIQTLSWRIDQKKQKNRNALIAYRKAITSGDFDNPARKDVPFSDPRIELIRSSARNLRRTLGITKDH